ncbi:hypothetical protein EGW08_008157 [Elysia chlorotica]|uniref:RING-type domain-containing protein n=1 Tax=Elysia chlorotica TaxID=188477 RepID=A0A433TR21_ELYCH|nr:hypothetical protein EGW08_008157 [Elysia chlorotica]
MEENNRTHGLLRDAQMDGGNNSQDELQLGNGRATKMATVGAERETGTPPPDPPQAAMPDVLALCPICQVPCVFPRLMPCYHTVCSACLDMRITSQISSDKDVNVFPCPVCSSPTKLPYPTGNQPGHPNYADRFELDGFIEKMSNVLSAFKDRKTCDLCQRRNISELASDWCMECLDAMCQGCLKVHLSGKTTRDHTVMSLGELRKLSLASVMRRGVPQACRTHTGETVRFYCLDCRVPVCVQCLTRSHRKCERCLPLEQAMTSMDDAVADVIVRMRSVTSGENGGPGGGGSDVNLFHSSAQSLEESVREAEEKIRSLANHLRQAVTEREQELLERLHSVASQLQEKVGDFRNLPSSREDDLRTIRSAHARLEVLMKYGSDVEVLDMYEAVQGPLSRLEGTEADTSGGTEDEVYLTVKFSPDELVQAFRQDFHSLGEITVQDSSSDEGQAAWGVAVTESDDIIVVDCRNRRVQKFGCSGDLLDHIQVSTEPRDVTCCGRSQNLKLRGGEGEEEVAVLLSGKQVYIITVSDKMALKRRFKTSKQYDSIAYSQNSSPLSGSTKSSMSGFFLVSSLEECCVDIISTEGDVINTFGGENPSSEKPLFMTPRYVAITKEGHFAVSDSGQNCVVCFTQNGGAEFRYAPDGSHNITCAQGVCGDRFGNLFVADYGSSRVHMVTSDGGFER